MHDVYTCPMHPEVTSNEPGRYPKCGMTLVKKEGAPTLKVIQSENDPGLGELTWKSYLPLIVTISLITVASVIVSKSSTESFALSFMTSFFLVFGMFKLMDLSGFKEGYSTYDLLAQKVPAYGYAYPFIEIAFGLLMLAGYHPDWLLWTEFVVMTFSGLGVAIKLAKREPFICACLGTFLKVPLTKVTLIEDFGMAILALMLLVAK